MTTGKIPLSLSLKAVIPLLFYKVEKTPENVSDPCTFEYAFFFPFQIQMLVSACRKRC